MIKNLPDYIFTNLLYLYDTSPLYLNAKFEYKSF